MAEKRVDSARVPPQGAGFGSGKVILLGEHAVVYGVPAIACGIDKGAEAVARPCSTDHIVFCGHELEPQHELYVSLLRLRESLGVSPARLELELAIPAGAGLGSSAAMAIAAARALCQLHGRLASNRELQLAAHAWEQVFHGTPSGIDAAAARSPGVVRYVRGDEPEPLALGRPLRLAIAQAGPSASTREMVQGVAKLKERNPEQFDKTLAAIESLVQNALVVLRQGDYQALGKLMDLNHMLLAGWMLSTSELEAAILLAREGGALGAKLTGAGGGGCVVALCAGEVEQEKILEAWAGCGLHCFSTLVEQS